MSSAPAAQAGTLNSSGNATSRAGVNFMRIVVAERILRLLDTVHGTPPATVVRTSFGAYAAATRPPSGDAIHRLDTSFGQPWWKFAVQHPKCGSRPKMLDSGPLVVH